MPFVSSIQAYFTILIFIEPDYNHKANRPKRAINIDMSLDDSHKSQENAPPVDAWEHTNMWNAYRQGKKEIHRDPSKDDKFTFS